MNGGVVTGHIDGGHSAGIAIAIGIVTLVGAAPRNAIVFCAKPATAANTASPFSSGAFISHGVAACIIPITIDLIRVVATDFRAADGGVVVVEVDPAAVAGRVARDRAVDDVGAAAVGAVDPAALTAGPVALDRAAGDGGAAVVLAVDPAATVSLVARDRAVDDGGAAVLAEDPAAGAGRVVPDRAVADGGVAVGAVDPAGVVG